jgi:hypothetical protein
VEQRKMNMRQDQGMNEYERRVNDGAIKAHERQDLNEIPYKLPGIKRIGEDKQDKYIDKQYI